MTSGGQLNRRNGLLPARSTSEFLLEIGMGVLQYVAKRVGIYLCVLLIGLTITFLLPRFMPDPRITAAIESSRLAPVFAVARTCSASSS